MRPPSMELRAKRSGAQAMIPCATPFSMPVIMSLKIGRPGAFALNHMAYFVLTHRLRQRLIASAPARIVNTASAAHQGQYLDFNDLQMEKHFRPWTAYAGTTLGWESSRHGYPLLLAGIEMVFWGLTRHRRLHSIECSQKTSHHCPQWLGNCKIGDRPWGSFLERP